MATPIALHLTLRNAALDSDLSAADLQRCNERLSQAGAQWEHRVVEFSPPAPGSSAADLAPTDLGMPEVLSALHQAKEIHLYGVEVRGLLQAMPYILPAALAQTPLIVHGPCASAGPCIDGGIPRLESWPGPVHYDRPAALSLGMDLSSMTLAPEIRPLDPYDLSLIPRQGETGPIPGLAEDNAVIVALSRRISEEILNELCEKVEGYFAESPAGVDVGWVRESKLLPQLARRHRRLAQLCIAASWRDPMCQEAFLSRTPLWVLNDEGSKLRSWYQALGVEPAQHDLNTKDPAAFSQSWQRAIQRWAQGESLETPAGVRQALMERCLSHRSLCA